MIINDSETNKVSIIIPTFRRGNEFLQRCIESVLSQTHKNIEIIIVDDNNNDEYSDIVKNTVGKYPESILQYIKTPKNLGAALSRNLGISTAKGEYITFLDDDDIYMPNKVEEQLKYMLENNLDMSFMDLGLYNSNNVLIDYRCHDYIDSCDNENLKKLHIMHNLTGTLTFMYKSKKLKSIGGFENTIISNEYYLMEKTISNNLKIGYISKSLVKAYRHKAGGLSFGLKKIEGERCLFLKKKNYFNLLSKKQIRYTICRYYAVMAVSYFRVNKHIKFMMYSALSLFTGPIIIVKELNKKKNLLKKYRRLNNNEE